MTNATLLTDLYQVTMAYGYWRTGRAFDRAVFHLFFRSAPFGGGYAIAAGLDDALTVLEGLRLTDADRGYLGSLRDGHGQPLFAADFIEALASLRFDGDVDAVPEGSVVFPHQPLMRVTAPIWAAQWVETALLNCINFQTLIATKAARVCDAAGPAQVLEFGLRRAQGPDGGLSASRAAYLGGCVGTSNVLAGQRYGIPVRGTHAHSWVMFHGDEREAFRAYAHAMPGNCVFLVDTYDTVTGIAHAIEVGHELRAHGHALAGVRLDSGDLAHLSQHARTALDAAGFPDAKVVASNDLDERVIASLVQQGARIDSYGVGTQLVTGGSQAALGGVYKLGAVADPSAPDGWRDVIKLSEQPIKVSNPGQLAVRRGWRDGAMVGDVIYDVTRGPTFSADATTIWTELLQPVMRAGQRQWHEPLDVSRARALRERQALSPRTRRFDNPQPYPVTLDPHVATRKATLIAAHRPEVS